MKKISRAVVVDGTREEFLAARDENLNALLGAIDDGASFVVVTRGEYLVFSDQAAKDEAYQQAVEIEGAELAHGDLSKRNVIWYV